MSVQKDHHASQRISILPYRSADAEPTRRIFYDAITVTASEDYTPEQIAAWARPGHRDLAEWNDLMCGRNSYVALVDDQVAGISDVTEQGYIEMLYVSPQFTGQGVAWQLLEFLEQQARDSAAQQLVADVSRTARPIFEARGFQVKAEQHPVIDGVAMVNFCMTKTLPQQG